MSGFTSHQHCKGYMVTFQLYWWKKTPGDTYSVHERVPLIYDNELSIFRIQ